MSKNKRIKKIEQKEREARVAKFGYQLPKKSDKINERRNEIADVAYSVLAERSKRLYGEGWINADILASECSRKLKPLNTHITTSGLIQILEKDKRFASKYAGQTKFRLENIKPVILDNSKILTSSNYSANTVIEDDSDAFREEYIKLLKANIVYSDYEEPTIGLDFGTSFTKAAFKISRTEQGLIPFGNQSMKASVVYTDQDLSGLSMFKTGSLCYQIKYFKATMNKEGYQQLMDDRTKLIDDFPYLCSVFFMANILKYIKLKLEAYYEKEIGLQVNMGMPTLYNDSISALYRKALHSAYWILCHEKQDISKLRLEQLRKYCKLAEASFKEEKYIPGGGGFHTAFPELFAEALYVLSRRNLDLGYYSIVDIGGGTADFMFLEKSSYREDGFTCYWAGVYPLGNEIRKALMEDPEQKYSAGFVSAFNQMLMESKGHIKNIGGKMDAVRTLIFGGGRLADDNYYEKLIQHNRLDYRQYGFETDIVDFNCNDIKKQLYEANQHDASPYRFVIAYQLAQSSGDSGKLQMLKKIMPKAKDQTVSHKDHILEMFRVKAGYEDFN